MFSTTVIQGSMVLLEKRQRWSSLGHSPVDCPWYNAFSPSLETLLNCCPHRRQAIGQYCQVTCQKQSGLITRINNQFERRASVILPNTSSKRVASRLL